MPRPAVDLTGQRYGRLTVVERLFERKDYLSSIWVCRCDCGNEAHVFVGNLKNGTSKSCGCLRKEILSRSRQSDDTEPAEKNKLPSGGQIKHGLSRSNEYHIWSVLKQRCLNPKDPKYHRYGGRGITVCKEWEESFETFYCDMGPRPSLNHSIERRDNDKGYEPGNCYWATRVEQDSNKSNSVLYALDGTYKTLPAWCRQFNINTSTVQYRLKRGIDLAEALILLPPK